LFIYSFHHQKNHKSINQSTLTNQRRVSRLNLTGQMKQHIGHKKY